MRRMIAVIVGTLAVVAGCSSSDNGTEGSTTVPDAPPSTSGPTALERCRDKLAEEFANLLDVRSSRALLDEYGSESGTYQAITGTGVISEVNLERTTHGIDAARDLLVRRVVEMCRIAEINNEVLDLVPGDEGFAATLAVTSTTIAVTTSTAPRRSTTPPPTTNALPATTTAAPTSPPATSDPSGIDSAPVGPVVDGECSTLPSGCGSNSWRCPWAGVDVLKPGDGVDSPCPAVEQLQQYLVAWGYQVDIDGRFGDGTEQAVRRFQADHDLAVDGLVGPDTWTLLAEADAWDM